MPNAVAIIIVNWERPDDTLACVSSVLPQLLPEDEIVVVDNGSQDDSVARFAAALGDDITLLCLPTNLGFTGGYNAGIAHALQRSVDHLFLLNNDTTIAPDCLRHLRGAKWDVVVPKIVFFDQPTLLWAAAARWRPFPPGVIMRGYAQPDTGQFDQAQSVDFVTGCAVWGAATVFRQVGGFDTQFGSYMEDYDFSFRIRQAGFALGYAPQAVVLHKVSQTLGEFSAEKWFLLGRNTALLFGKHRSLTRWQFWLHVGWVSLRELLKRKPAGLRAYWRGIVAVQRGQVTV